MSPLLLVTAALAAQATQGGTPPPATPEPGAAPARTAGQSTYVDVEGGVGYSTNPLLSLSSHQGSADGRISLHGVHTRVTERSTTILSAFAQELGYTNHHGSQQSVALDARHDSAVSENLRIFGDLSASYDKGGQLDTRIIGVPNVPLPPGTILPPGLLPSGSDFLSITGRTYHFAANAGAQFALSAHDSVAASSGISRVVFKSRSNDSGYWTVPVSLAYNRQLSPTTTVGARVVATDTEYQGPGSVRTITPQLTGTILLSERFTLGADVGVSFSRVDDGVRTLHSTGATADANLCSRSERSQLCARAFVDQQTATVAGPAKSVGGSFDYSNRLDADSTIQFSLGASHYSTPISVISGRTFSSATYYRSAASYTRRISDRWFTGVNLSARKLSQKGPDPKADLSGSLFIRYRFGDLQ